jgi:hypothetical protein
MPVPCPYCEQPCQLVTGDKIYPGRDDLSGKKFWRCYPCRAYVGCHPGTERPLGTPARANLRAARNRAHASFDPLWKSLKKKNARKRAYKWLAEQMGIENVGRDCHIGLFDQAQCAQVVEICEQTKAEIREKRRAKSNA